MQNFRKCRRLPALAGLNNPLLFTTFLFRLQIDYTPNIDRHRLKAGLGQRTSILGYGLFGRKLKSFLKPVYRGFKNSQQFIPANGATTI